MLSLFPFLPPTKISSLFLFTKSKYKPATLKKTLSCLFFFFPKQAITTGGVTYREQPWHKECFVCTACKKQLSGQRFTSRDEFAYCLSCFCNLYAKKCAGCTNPISGRSLMAGAFTICGSFVCWVATKGRTKQKVSPGTRYAQLNLFTEFQLVIFEVKQETITTKRHFPPTLFFLLYSFNTPDNCQSYLWISFSFWNSFLLTCFFSWGILPSELRIKSWHRTDFFFNHLNALPQNIN